MPQLTADDYQLFPYAEPDYRGAYGPGDQQFGELYLPPSTAAPRPVVLLIHGGGYREIYNLRPLGQMARSLTELGCAVWNIEYRRHGNGGDFPRMFQDVAAAADHLRALAAEHPLDLQRIITMGHSAGGHLALWLAGRSRIPAGSPLFGPNPLPLRAVLALAPLADIRRAAQGDMCSDALLSVMGGDPAAAPDNYRAGSPRELLPLGVPQTIIVGEDDRGILDNASAYAAAAVDSGDAVRLVTLPGAGHFEVVAQASPHWRRVHETLREFIKP